MAGNTTFSRAVKNTANSVCGTECPDDLHVAIYYLIFSPFFFMGLVGNGALMFVIGRQQKMRTLLNRLVFSLCLADILVILCSLLSPFLDNSAYVPATVCESTRTLREAAVGALVYTLVALIAKRYFSIAFPQLVKRLSNGTVDKVGIAIWIVAIILAAGKLSSLDFECTRNGSKINTAEMTSRYSIIGFLLIYFIPLVLMTVLFSLMVHKLYMTVQHLAEDTGNRSQIERLILAKRKMAVVVLSLSVSFMVCFFPYYAIRLMAYFGHNTFKFWAKYTSIIMSVSIIHPCTNPLILYMMSSLCRKHLKGCLSNCIQKILGSANLSRTQRDEAELQTFTNKRLTFSLSS